MRRPQPLPHPKPHRRNVDPPQQRQEHQRPERRQIQYPRAVKQQLKDEKVFDVLHQFFSLPWGEGRGEGPNRYAVPHHSRGGVVASRRAAAPWVLSVSTRYAKALHTGLYSIRSRTQCPVLPALRARRGELRKRRQHEEAVNGRHRFAGYLVCTLRCCCANTYEMRLSRLIKRQVLTAIRNAAILRVIQLASGTGFNAR